MIAVISGIALFTVGFICTILLFTKEHKRQIRERDSELHFQSILENVDLLIVIIDNNGQILFANDYLVEWSGYQRKQLSSGNWFKLFYPFSQRSEAKTNFVPARVEDEGLSIRIEEQNITATGEPRTVAWARTLILDDRDRVTGMMLVGEDITLKHCREEMFEEIFEKHEFILLELHHHMNNNLQLILGILSLQKMRAPEAEAQALARACNCIRSLAIVHELFYSSNDFGSIDLRGYIQLLIKGLLKRSDGAPIFIDLDLASVIVSLDEAIPCGLIFTEAFTNAQKYAFPPGWEGERRICVRVGRSQSGKRYLEVKDNGAGLRNGFDITKSSKFGYTVMQLLSEQLNGRLSFSEIGGTSILLVF